LDPGPSSTASFDLFEAQSSGPERTAVMPSPSREDTASAKVSPTYEVSDSEELVDKSEEARKPAPKWVEGRGYDDDARISPFIDPAKPIEDIDLSDRP